MTSENDPIVYDKGKYHDDTIASLGLPDRQACVHTAIFLGWILDNDLYSEFLKKESAGEIQGYKERKFDAVDFYDHWDRCLISDMLNDDGNKFASAYFDFEKGKYINDYIEKMQRDLPSEFHVEYSWKNQKIMGEVISKRYNEWKSGEKKKWWKIF